MSMSGIEIDPDCATIFNEVKLRSTNLFMIFKIADKKKVVIDEKAEEEREQTKKRKRDKGATWDDFVAILRKVKSKREARYAIYDFKFVADDGRKIEKLAFIFWCPDDIPIGPKMTYASTKDSLKKKFTGLSLEFQLNAEEDLDYEYLKQEVEKKA